MPLAVHEQINLLQAIDGVNLAVLFMQGPVEPFHLPQPHDGITSSEICNCV